jgi:hypothetical protein
MVPNVQSNTSKQTAVATMLCIVVVTIDRYVETRSMEAFIAILVALLPAASLIEFKPSVDRVVARTLLVLFFLVYGFVKLDILKDRSQSVIDWQNNPTLPQASGYEGDINSTYYYLPADPNTWSYGVEFTATETQIVLIAGYEAKFEATGRLGTQSHCYLLITRGPISEKIDLVASSLEVHNVDSSAKTLEWAAQKVYELKKDYSGCDQHVDLRVGR